MRPLLPLPLLALAMLLLTGCAATPNGPVDAHRTPASPSDATYAQLQQPIDADFDQTPLADALSTIADRASVNMFVNWAALKAVGIQKDMPVSMTLHDLPASVVLDCVMERARVKVPLNPLGFSTLDGIVTVSTSNELKKHTTLRTYDIAGLLAFPEVDLAMLYDEHHLPAPLRRMELEQVLLHGNPPPPSFDAPAHPIGPKPPTWDERVKRIMSLITDTVGHPAAWTDSHWWLRELHGQLIVKTTPSNHREIRHLLAQMHDQRVERLARGLRAVKVVKLLREAEQRRLNQDEAGALKLAQRAQDVAPDNELVRAELRVLRQTMNRR